jgi:hypothetical protein
VDLRGIEGAEAPSLLIIAKIILTITSLLIKPSGMNRAFFKGVQFSLVSNFFMT